MDLDLVRAAIGVEYPSMLNASGLYVWADTWRPGQPVLYIGQAGNVRSRTNDERWWARGFREHRDRGQSLWQSSGCALSPILAAAIETSVVMWPMDEQRRAATETALVRLAAMTGATPPAQGGGWDRGRESSVNGQAASSILDQWFTLGHALAAALAPQP